MSRKQTPSDFLKLIIGRPVVVKLNNGMDYRGKQLERKTRLHAVKLQGKVSLLDL
jgi:hypothetical protein